MPKRSKKFNEAQKLIDKEKVYEPEEGFALLKQAAYVKFDETVDVSIRLGVDPRHADQKVRGTLVLPNGTGQSRKVLVFAKGDKAKEAEDAGADYVGGEELAEKITGGWVDFDIAIATPDMMGVVGKLGRVLGPRGLMPKPKVGTVTNDVAKAVEESKAGKIEYNVDKAGIVHVPVGKISFEAEQLVQNYRALIDALLKAKPAAAKGQYLKTAHISSTMGPGLKVATSKTIGS